MKESDYRSEIQQFLNRIEKLLADVDPDLVECQQAMGAMTLTFTNRHRCVLSAQPSVQQLWVAMAAKGTAYHFNFDLPSRQWVDDKGAGVNAARLIEGFVKEFAQIEIEIKI